MGKVARYGVSEQYMELETRGKDPEQAAFTTARTATLDAPGTLSSRRLWNVLEKVVRTKADLT